MRKRRRGRYLKSREEQISVLRTDIDAINPVIVVLSEKAIVTITQVTSRSNVETMRGFGEADRVFLVTFNFPISSVKEEDVVVRHELLIDPQSALDYDLKNEPLYVSTIERTRKSTRLICSDKQRK